ncbi:CLUMA_CG021149, isoform A [Clunio marinus]|uniref:CLUMA_CG021149, isoform A n=1 Tax=Clunio marinus TaxID=568069 RepID=A0A1J1J860_9DIPT|nr:CLUMA_CG021149, isoform A [Clunio marinus]
MSNGNKPLLCYIVFADEQLEICRDKVGTNDAKALLKSLPKIRYVTEPSTVFIEFKTPKILSTQSKYVVWKREKYLNLHIKDPNLVPESILPFYDEPRTITYNEISVIML